MCSSQSFNSYLEMEISTIDQMQSDGHKKSLASTPQSDVWKIWTAFPQC